MKVRFDFTLDDMVDAARRGVKRSAVVRTLRWQEVGLAAFVGAALVFLLRSGSMESRLADAAIGAIVCAVIVKASAGRTQEKRLRKLFREQLGGDGPFTCEVELSAEGVTTTQAGTRSLSSWSKFTAVEDTPDSVDLIARGTVSLVVRNRAFRTPEERSQFLALARSYVDREKE